MTTSPLERVIAEQQAEIDRWKARDAASDRAWGSHTKKYENLVQAAFMVLDSTSPEARFHLKQILIEQGWCMTCEQFPCECDGQYD